MSKSARTVFFFGIYMIFQTILYLSSPQIILNFFGIPESAALWLHVIGAIMAGLCFYYLLMSKREIRLFFQATVYERTFEFFALSALVLFNNGPKVLYFFAFMDLIGAIWTQLTLNREK